ncbi:MAG: hypothetical protein JNJ77_20540 [Planctomycetia bacterium]|nr:hypothetical protein [Planctomycetia bacterium]
MQTSHVISDLFLASTCLWVLYQCWKRHESPLIIVWGLFFGFVGLAAFFGALRFADVHPNMVHVSQFFQRLASTLGSCGLVAGVAWLFKRYHSLPLLTCTVIACIACVVADFIIDKTSYYSIVQMIAMVLVLAIAVFHWIKRRLPEHRTMAWRLVLAIVLSALATTSLQMLPAPYSIDAFHYLLGAGILCFGWAAMSQLESGQALTPQV